MSDSATPEGTPSSDVTPETKAGGGSNRSRIVLLVVLAVMIAALLFDLNARRQAAAALDVVVPLVEQGQAVWSDETAESGKVEPITPEKVAEAVGQDQEKFTEYRTRSIQIFAWQGVGKKHRISVSYRPTADGTLSIAEAESGAEE